MGIEIIIVITLILVNGLFAMTELALSTAKKARLEEDAGKGSKRAATALKLVNEPNRFLSTVQIGITLIGILTGVFSGDRIADDVKEIIDNNAFFRPYSENISIVVVVGFITYLTLILGEIVPKRIALAHSENIAKFFAGPMNILSLIARPLIWLLSISTEFALKLLRVKKPEEDVTEAEIKELINIATRTGTIEKVEKEIVERTFSLSDKKIAEVMIKKENIVWLDINSPLPRIEEKLINNIHRIYPIADKTVENILGFIHIKDLLAAFVKKETEIEIKNYMEPIIRVRANADAYHVFNLFKEKKTSMAVVTDAGDRVNGLITMDDLVDELVGELEIMDNSEEMITDRGNGSWFVDGRVKLGSLAEYFGLQEKDFDSSGYETLAGFISKNITGSVKTGSKVEKLSFCFEIADMDGTKIDKILITKK